MTTTQEQAPVEALTNLERHMALSKKLKEWFPHYRNCMELVRDAVSDIDAFEISALRQPQAARLTEDLAKAAGDWLKAEGLCEPDGRFLKADFERAERLTALLRLTAAPAPQVTRDEIDHFATAATSWLCELPDRTSPEDEPEMCLVTGEELHGYLTESLAEFLALRGLVKEG